MPTKKELNKKEEKCSGHECCCGEFVSDVKESVVNFSKEIKDKYNKLDESDRQNVKKGLMGIAGVFLGLVGLKKIFGRRHKEE